MFLYDVKDILHSSQDTTTNSLNCAIGDTNGQVFQSEVQMWGQCGLLSKPPKIDTVNATDAPQLLTLPAVDYPIGIAYRYVAGQALVGPLNDGSTCLYANGPINQGTTKITLDGSIINITTGIGQINLIGSVASVGSGTDFVAKATPTQAIITALQTFSASLSGSSDPVVVAAAAALNSALSGLLVASNNLKVD